MHTERTKTCPDWCRGERVHEHVTNDVLDLLPEVAEHLADFTFEASLLARFYEDRRAEIQRRQLARNAMIYNTADPRRVRGQFTLLMRAQLQGLEGEVAAIERLYLFRARPELNAACPTCRRKKNQPCRTKQGKPAKRSHLARLALL